MTIALAMVAKDEEAHIATSLGSVKELVDHWTLIDTGSTDKTIEIAQQVMEGVPGVVYEQHWKGYPYHAEKAIAYGSRTGCTWVLRLDADMRVEAHPDLKQWLDEDPDPDVNAWQVEIHEGSIRWRLPLITRGGQEVKYVGDVHEYLQIEGKQRPLLGLTVIPFRQRSREDHVARLNAQLVALRPGMEAGEARATFYTAECLRFLGETEAAASMYDRRAEIQDFEEERWYATYQAAKLRKSTEDLVNSWRQRPWRHEPLSAAARIVAGLPNNDVLFLEDISV